MGTAIRDEPDKPATAKANTHTYRTNHRKTEQEGPSSHPVTVALETVPKPDRKTGKERKNNQKDNKNAQKRGTENLIRGKSVAPNLNIYAKKNRPRNFYVSKNDPLKCIARSSNPGHPDKEKWYLRGILSRFLTVYATRTV